MRRSITVALLVLLVRPVAADDPVNPWNRTYKKGGMGGTTPPCADSLEDVTVKDGHFSLPWTLKVRDKPVTIGRIEGTVRPSGLAIDVKAVFLDPLPHPFIESMNANHESIDDLRKLPLKVKFQQFSDGREISVWTEQWQCHTWWKEDRASLQAA